MGAAFRAKFLVTVTRDGSTGSGLGLMRLPNGRGVGRDGDGDASVPISRLRLLVVRASSDAAGCSASLRPLRRPEDLCSLSEVRGIGVEGASCLILRLAGLVPTARPGWLSDAIEAAD